MVEVPKVIASIVREETPTGGRYVAHVKGHSDAEMSFSKAGAKIQIIDHTAVPDDLSGQGVGRALVEYMVMDVRSRGIRIIPLCPFARATLEKHKEWQDVLKDPI